MLFSVIVPVYNVADYLPKCMDSLLRQSCEDWEILLVDDGSTDGKCPALCDEYAARFPELVRVIHQPNGGLGAARNAGIEQARGEYLLFVDSDDTIAENTLSRLREELRGNDVDMVISSYRYLYESGEERPADPLFSRVTGQIQTLADTPEMLLDPPSAVNHLCRRSLFMDHQIRFPGRVWFEDLCTTPSLLLYAGSILQLKDPFYGYLLRKGSIMRSANLKRNLEILNALEMARAPFEQAGRLQEFKPWLTVLAVNSVLDAARRVLIADPEAEYLPEFLDYVKKTWPDYRSCERLALLGRKKLIFLRLLERKQYKLARAMFSLAGKLKGR